MSKLKVKTDAKFDDVQIYGTYRYNKQLEKGQYILSKVSKRKDYPDVLSRSRSEDCITDAITNYKAEINTRNEQIRAKVSTELAAEKLQDKGY
jgi:hypothetical protein